MVGVDELTSNPFGGKRRGPACWRYTTPSKFQHLDLEQSFYIFGLLLPLRFSNPFVKAYLDVSMSRPLPRTIYWHRWYTQKSFGVGMEVGMEARIRSSQLVEYSILYWLFFTFLKILCSLDKLAVGEWSLHSCSP